LQERRTKHTRAGDKPLFVAIHLAAMGHDKE
jgi:hypothetical protein